MLADLRVVTSEHLRLLDDRMPGLVTDLLITGSIALDDYRPGMSDIDFVAVMGAEPTPEQLAILPELHQQLPKGPNYDGIYLTSAQLIHPPVSAPQILAGDFDPAKSGGQLTPVTRLELSRYAIAIRGRRPAINVDLDVLREWLRGNLSGYWTKWTLNAGEHLRGLPPAEPIEQYLIIWGVLGPGRLRYTLATGDIISKTGAGRYTAEHYPAWRDLCERAVRARAGEPMAFTAADGVAMTELMQAVIDG
ncbi:MAG TPA: hypothetical protein DGG94_11765 [Micromonosporaceae bacterium]|nr:hypothetical protein [Micromonosporaceae bacterium]HCU50457.1 hypothetical protein [Micromonosporaceae bacterium]